MKLSEISGGGDTGAKTLKLSDVQQAADDTSLPFEDEPGMRRNPILPFAQRLGEKRQHERGELTGEIATPGFVTSIARGVASASEKIRGVRSPYDQPYGNLSDEEKGAAMAFGSLPGPAVGMTRALAKPAATSTKGAPLSPGSAEVVRRLQQGEKAGGPGAQQILDEFRKTPDKPLTLADLGPESVRSLAGRAFRSGGEARNIIRKGLDDRDLTAGKDLEKDVAKYFGTGSARQTTTRLLKERSAAARPKYAEMEQLQNIWSPRLQEFLDNPELKQAMALGFKLERMDALAEGRAFNPTQMGINLDAEGNIVLKKTPNMRVLDIGKQGLDAVIASERDEITGRLSKTGRSYEKVRSAYLGLLDELDTTGTYKRARESWAGPSASLDAVRAGRTIFNRSPEEIAEHFAKLSPADKQFYRLGVADMILERIQKTGLGSDESNAIIRNARNRAQLRPLFETEGQFDQFVNSVEAQRKMFNTRRSVTGGSQTAERLAEDTSPHTEAAMHGAKSAIDLGKGNILGSGINAFRAWNAMRAIQDPAVSAEVARLLSTPLNEADSSAMKLLTDYGLGLPSTRKYVTRPTPGAP